MVRRGNYFKYETQFKVPYEIVKTWTNGNITIQMGAITYKLNIRGVKPYKLSEVD